jgi:UDP-2,4-diacetamido-2,4,6-trideoxy-beta-L-altropyranose hydrolase
LEKPGHLIICAECGIQVGTGHVMRCLALAQAWKRAGGAVTFLVNEGLPAIEVRIHAEGIPLAMLPKNSELSLKDFVCAAAGADHPIAVLDGYSFGAPDQAMLCEAGIQVLTVDDYSHATEYPARWVLNQNVYATAEMYAKANAKPKLLLGPEYALLRDEFLPWIGWKRSIPGRARKILITLGGSDPENVSEKILRSFVLLEHKDLEAVLVVGGGNPHWESLRALVEHSVVPVRIVRSVQDMPALMAWADVAIAGAGVTSYELCYMGLPSLLLIVAENQRQTAEGLSDLGMAVNAGTTSEFQPVRFAGQLLALIESCERREAMSHLAHGLADGLGSERVRAALLGREMNLRRARELDSRLLFGWANDPVTRAVSFHSTGISWEDHTRWFAERLHDSQSVVYIGENVAGEPVGLVRFQIQGDTAVLSVNVAPEFRGQGWGRELITFSTRSLFRGFSVRRVHAFVKPDNRASVRLFETSGFHRSGEERAAGQNSLLFVWESGSRIHVH